MFIMAFITPPSSLSGAPATSSALNLALNVAPSFHKLTSEIFFAPISSVAINPETPEWLRTVVWTDFRLAVAFFVISPLFLLGWSALECRPGKKNELSADAILRIMTGYWQASSLLLITVLLNMEASPIGVVTGAVAQFMIFVSLNWWTSLTMEAEEDGSTIQSQIFGSWRTITSWVAGFGVATQVPFLPCVVATNLVDDPYCAAWLEPPRMAAMLLGIAEDANLNELATAGLTIYIAYLVYYLTVILPSIGRKG
jgi:hypothetical protein